MRESNVSSMDDCRSGGVMLHRLSCVVLELRRNSTSLRNTGESLSLSLLLPYPNTTSVRVYCYCCFCEKQRICAWSPIFSNRVSVRLRLAQPQKMTPCQSSYQNHLQSARQISGERVQDIT